MMVYLFMQVVFVCFLQIVSMMLYMVYIGEFSNLVFYRSYKSFSFFHMYLELLQYLKNNRVSHNLVKQVDNYCHHVWRERRGEQFPYFITHAPNCLKLKIMAAAYMDHLTSNPIFAECEPAFLRQLVGYFKHYTYNKDLYIVREGEITDSMYFVHAGHILRVPNDVNRRQKSYYTGQYFGVIQGLQRDFPHTNTYQAKQNSLVLTLDLKDWIHLLSHYPKSKENIYKFVNFDVDDRKDHDDASKDKNQDKDNIEMMKKKQSYYFPGPLWYNRETYASHLAMGGTKTPFDRKEYYKIHNQGLRFKKEQTQRTKSTEKSYTSDKDKDLEKGKREIQTASSSRADNAEKVFYNVKGKVVQFDTIPKQPRKIGKMFLKKQKETKKEATSSGNVQIELNKSGTVKRGPEETSKTDENKSTTSKKQKETKVLNEKSKDNIEKVKETDIESTGLKKMPSTLRSVTEQTTKETPNNNLSLTTLKEISPDVVHENINKNIEALSKPKFNSEPNLRIASKESILNEIKIDPNDIKDNFNKGSLSIETDKMLQTIISKDIDLISEESVLKIIADKQSNDEINKTPQVTTIFSDYEEKIQQSSNFSPIKEGTTSFGNVKIEPNKSETVKLGPDKETFKTDENKPTTSKKQKETKVLNEKSKDNIEKVKETDIESTGLKKIPSILRSVTEQTTEENPNNNLSLTTLKEISPDVVHENIQSFSTPKFNSGPSLRIPSKESVLNEIKIDPNDIKDNFNDRRLSIETDKMLQTIISKDNDLISEKAVLNVVKGERGNNETNKTPQTTTIHYEDKMHQFSSTSNLIKEEATSSGNVKMEPNKSETVKLGPDKETSETNENKPTSSKKPESKPDKSQPSSSKPNKEN